MKHVKRLVWMACCATAASGAANAQTAASAGVQIFAPGVVSGVANEDSAAFTPDGDTVFFDRISWPNAAILVSHRAHGAWSAPVIAPFSGQWLDHDPAMAPDGSFIVFSSNRPDKDGGKALDAVMANGKVATGSGGHLWRVERKGSGWGKPWLLPDAVNSCSRTYAPSVVADGTDGLDDLRLIVAQAPQHLEAGGWLMLEHGYDQADAVRDLLLTQGFEEVHSRKDLGDHERISLGRLPC